jgi:hypothetical protein
VLNGQEAQQFFPMRSEFDQHFAPILFARAALNGATFRKPVDEFDSTVVTQTEAIRNGTDCRSRTRWKTFDGKHQLMLLRLNAVPARGLFTKSQELAYAVPEFGKAFKQYG